MSTVTTIATLPVLESHAAGSGVCGFSYFGNNTGWHIAATTHRDADLLQESNFEVLRKDLLTRFPGDAEVERMSSDLVGYVYHLIVRPATEAYEAALTWRTHLEDYVVADEEDYARREWENESCLRKRCWDNRKDHPTSRCKRFRSEADVETITFRWRQRGVVLHTSFPPRLRDPFTQEMFPDSSAE